MHTDREFLRHALATLAYRGGKVVRDAPADVATLKLHEKARTPLEILAHVNDLLDWVIRMTSGEFRWVASTPQPWHVEADRFFATLTELDARLADDTLLDERRVFQGPIADALTHIGQLALLRRVADAPIHSENYFKADIVAGRVGRAQTPPKLEW